MVVDHIIAGSCAGTEHVLWATGSRDSDVGADGREEDAARGPHRAPEIQFGHMRGNVLG